MKIPISDNFYLRDSNAAISPISKDENRERWLVWRVNGGSAVQVTPKLIIRSAFNDDC